MTATSTAAGGAPPPGETPPFDETPPPDETPLAPAGERGALTIADRVVEKIAAQAVSEVDNATGVARQVLGRGREAARTTARVSARVDGDTATLEVVMAVLWPAPVLEVTRRVREHVADRLAELATMRVAEIDIEVAGLPTSYGPRLRRVK